MSDGLEITVKDSRWKKNLPHYRAFCRKAINSVIDLKNNTVSVVLADDTFVHALNLEYRHIDRPTNVLSFPMPFVDIPMRPMGDIVLSLDTLEKECMEQHKTLQEHLAHLLIHGALHLSGYDHITDEQAHEMESLEIETMEKLGFENPYKGEQR